MQAGLAQGSMNPVTKAPEISSWKAEPWMAGGMAAIMLDDANDHATEQQVTRPAGQAGSGSGQRNRGDSGSRRRSTGAGPFPDAAFLVVLKPGYYAGSRAQRQPGDADSGTRGSHGFSPEVSGDARVVLCRGAGIAHHRDLGVVDMRQIAPTVAGILHVPCRLQRPRHCTWRREAGTKGSKTSWKLGPICQGASNENARGWGNGAGARSKRKML
jgi:hypothetical protein